MPVAGNVSDGEANGTEIQAEDCVNYGNGVAIAIPVCATAPTTGFIHAIQSAAHYEVSYSGGTWASTGNSLDLDGDFEWSEVEDAYGAEVPSGGGWYSGETPIFLPAEGQATCSGTITVTFTWNDGGDENNLPPPVVLVKETSIAEWDGDDGNCDNGLGHDPEPTSHGEVSEGSKWRAVEDPGPTFQIQCSPSASATLEEVEYPHLAANAEVWYSVECIVTTLLLSGVLEPGVDNRLMIGQRLEAEVTYDGDVPTGANDKYVWSTSGGEPFADYFADEEEGELVPWSPLETITTFVYFAEPVEDLIIFAQVTLSDVNPQLIANPDIEFTVYGAVETVAPNLGLSVVLGHGDLYPSTSNPTKLQLWHGVRLTITSGIWFVGSVDTPADFDDTDDGTWNWTQLVTGTNRWYRNSSDEYYDRNSNFSSGDPRLDTNFPYKNTTFPANGSVQASDDVPSEPISGGHEEIAIEDHFFMYVLYLPPGANSKYVPLRRITWWWQAHALKGTPNWSITQSDEEATIEGVESGLPQHPEWTDNIANYPGYTLRSSPFFR